MVQINSQLSSQIMGDLGRDFGLTTEETAAVLGNLAHESDNFKATQEYNPTVPGSRGGYGWAQWTGPRRVAFEKYVKEEKLDPTSYKANYGFLSKELRGTHKSSLAKLKAAKGLHAKTKAFELSYEGAGTKHYTSRYAYADAALKGYAPFKGPQQAIDQERQGPRSGLDYTTPSFASDRFSKEDFAGAPRMGGVPSGAQRMGGVPSGAQRMGDVSRDQYSPVTGEDITNTQAGRDVMGTLGDVAQYGQPEAISGQRMGGIDSFAGAPSMGGVPSGAQRMGGIDSFAGAPRMGGIDSFAGAPRMGPSPPNFQTLSPTIGTMPAAQTITGMTPEQAEMARMAEQYGQYRNPLAAMPAPVKAPPLAPARTITARKAPTPTATKSSGSTGGGGRSAAAADESGYYSGDATAPGYAASVTRGGEGSGTDDSDTKVLCGHYNRQGWLNDATYKLDVEFGASCSVGLVLWYHSWAKPLVKILERSAVVELMVWPLVWTWATTIAQIAHSRMKENT